MKNNKIAFLQLCSTLFLIVFLLNCESRQKQTEDSRENFSDLKQKQYYIEGKRLYKIHCSNCHMDEGEGLARLIPPLAQSDFMLSDISRTICIIKYGIAGEIDVNGVYYNQPMPGLIHLKDIEIAEIATYIYNSWGHNEGIISIPQVKEALKSCNKPTLPNQQ